MVARSAGAAAGPAGGQYGGQTSGNRTVGQKRKQLGAAGGRANALARRKRARGGTSGVSAWRAPVITKGTTSTPVTFGVFYKLLEAQHKARVKAPMGFNWPWSTCGGTLGFLLDYTFLAILTDIATQ